MKLTITSKNNELRTDTIIAELEDDDFTFEGTKDKKGNFILIVAGVNSRERLANLIYGSEYKDANVTRGDCRALLRYLDFVESTKIKSK